MPVEERATTTHWMSRKGASTGDNRDACGIFSSPCTTLAMIADAAELGHDGAGLAGEFIRSVMERAVRMDDPVPERIVEIMRTVHGEIRLRYLAEKACYSALLIRHDLNEAWTITCGDCRVGRYREDGQIDWITPVHCMATPFGQAFTAVHACLADRHTVTRRLHARRFDAPEIRFVEDYSVGTSWVLATDGYWIESLKGDQMTRDVADDDASWMLMSFERDHEFLETDCGNWYRLKG